MAVNFPDSPSDQDTFDAANITFKFDAAKNQWSPQNPAGSSYSDSDVNTHLNTSSATSSEVLSWNGSDYDWVEVSSVTSYNTIDDLPLSGVNNGAQALVLSTNTLYIWNQGGWYKIALINTNPSISNVASSYTLSNDGSATEINIVASDPEGIPITYSLVSDTSANTATVVQGTGANTNIFTITPSTNSADAGTFSLTFRASDGVNITSAVSSFSLVFSIVNSQYTSALITSVGANLADNNDFVDSSTNSHTITPAGNVTQNTFSPYRHGGNSVSFAGTNSGSENYLWINAAIVPATGSWTYESWVKIDRKSDGERHSLISWYTNGVAGRGNIFVRADNETNPGIVFVYVDGMSVYPQSTTRIDDSAWHHVAVERDGNVWSVWIDGTREDQQTQNVTINTSVNTRLGHIVNTAATSHSGLKGLMRDVRFSTSARYSGAASIGVPSEDQATTTGYALLCCQSFDPYTDKTGNREITVYSGTSVKQIGAGPYTHSGYSSGSHGASMYFDGSGDYLTTPTHASFSLGSGDLTIEGWFYNTSTAQYQFIFDGRQGAGASDTTYLYTTNGTTLKAGFGNTEDSTAATIVQNQWYHFAIVRSGSGTNNVTLYLNGKNVWNITDNTDLSSSTRMTVGNRYNIVSDFGGHVSDFRVVKGTAVYTGDFSPPNGTLTTTGGSYPSTTNVNTSITNTSLLLNGTDAGIIDKSQSVKTITLDANAKSSTTQSKYLTSSMYFATQTDFLKAELAAPIGIGDFTIEWWVYFTNINPGGSNFRAILDMRHSGDTSNLWLQQSGDGSWSYYPNYPTTGFTSSTFSNNTWYHIAIARENGTIRFYVDGSLTGSGSDSFDYDSVFLNLNHYTTSLRRWTGYASDLRVTKGLARYTAADETANIPSAALQG